MKKLKLVGLAILGVVVIRIGLHCWSDPSIRFLLYPLGGLITLIVVWVVDEFPTNDQSHQGHVTSSPVLLMIWAWPLFWLVAALTTVEKWLRSFRN